MITVSLDTAARLIGQTKRHIRRRIAEGSLTKVSSSDLFGRTHISLDAIRVNIGYPLTNEDISNIVKADAGDALAQEEVAIFFLEAGNQERALAWLQISAKNGCADAMLMLGENYLAGQTEIGTVEAGLYWLERAAMTGMLLAKQTLEGLKDQLTIV